MKIVSSYVSDGGWLSDLVDWCLVYGIIVNFYVGFLLLLKFLMVEK